MEPWIGFPGETLTGGFVQVDSAARAEASTSGPAEGLKRQVQQHVFAHEPREIETVTLQDIHIHVRGGQLELVARKGILGRKE